MNAGRRRRLASRFPTLDRRRAGRVAALLAIAFVVGYLLTWLVFSTGAPPSEVVTVPDLRSLTLRDARARLGRVDLELNVGDTLPNPDLPAGAVVAQTPLPGEETSPGTDVRVVVSTGPARHAIPAVNALPAALATRALEAVGFQVVRVDTAANVPTGNVVAVAPPVGMLAPLHTPVRLFVSSGPPPVPVPDVIGLSREQAQATLEAVGLHLGDVDTGGLLGRGVGEVVTDQQPAPGDTVPVGVPVRVRVGAPRPGTF